MKRLIYYALAGGVLLVPVATHFSRARLVASQASPPTVSRPTAPGSPLAFPVSVAGPPPSGPARAAAPAVTGNSNAFGTFTVWAEQFLTGTATLSTAQGEALAWRRREAMLALIQAHPEQALAQAVPWRWRQELPASITRHFEERIDGRGALDVAVATDFARGRASVYREAQLGGRRFQAFVYGRRQGQPCLTGIPLHGIALEGKLALAADPLRRLEPAEAQALAQGRGERVERTGVCRVCGRGLEQEPARILGDIGGELAGFCGSEHEQLAHQQQLTAESGGGPRRWGLSASASSWTHGPKTVLYIRVNFPDDLTEPISETSAYGVMNEVNAFYAESSYDQTALTTTVTPLITVPQIKAWYHTAGTGALLADAREAARAAGYDTANYDLDIVCHTSVPGYDWGGLGYVGGKGVWLQSAGAGVTAHELGHNYGLMHGNFWDARPGGSGSGAGTNLEYGNSFDTMGSANAGAYQFNAYFKNALGWLPDNTIQAMLSNGVCRIYPFDVPSRTVGRTYGARVRKDALRDYWLEFRSQFTANSWLQYGLLLNWSPWDQSSGGTQLVDTSPGTPTAGEHDSRADAAVVIGRTFTDPAAAVHFTPLARGATGTNAWIDLQVNLGPFPDNRPPRLQVEIDPTNAAPGQLVHFHATATDPDGDSLAYAWTFDDFTFSTNNLPWTYHQWNGAGEYVVRCVVSDMKGGMASANAVVIVGQPDAFHLAGRITDPEGHGLEGVRLDNNPTNTSDYVGGFTDSQGDYFVPDAPTDFTLYLTKYGYVSTNFSLSLTSSVADLNVVLVPLPSVQVRASTNSVRENAPGRVSFTLERTGDLANELTANVYLSGSASLANDYRLDPELTNTFNAVLFPAGTGTVTVAVQVVDDSLVEGAEAIALTLLEDPAYAITQHGEATITILDNDNPRQPAVSVAAAAPSVPENGSDRGAFILTRTGEATNDLPVFYTVAGSATAGSDYTALLGVAVIPAGKSSVPVEFAPLDDKAVELDETVVLTLSSNPNYTLGASSAQIAIVDDDFLTVTIAPTGGGAAEPASAGRFTVKRDGDLTPDLVVHYTVSGSASNGVDYQPLSGAVTIPAGAPSAEIFVQPINDTVVEGDESVTLTLRNETGYDVGTPGTATLWIRDDEKPAVSLVTADDEAAEPGDNTGLFTLSRGTLRSGNLTVQFQISGTAINGVDYVPLESTVVIPDGVSQVDLELIPFDDLHHEPTETVILSLLPGTNYILGSSTLARVRLLDNDEGSVPAVGFATAASGALESQSPGVTLALSATSSAPITVECRVIGGTASTNEYQLPSTTLSFEPGEWAKSLPLLIKDNNVVQPERTLRLVLFNPANATLDGLKIHTYTILDDDLAAVSINANPAAAAEAGPVAGAFRIARTGATNNNLRVYFQVTGTASAPTDYAPLGTSVLLPAGVANVDLPVVPVEDRTVEGDQTVVVTLTSAPGAKLSAPNAATLTIHDNDLELRPLVSLTATNHPFAVEGGGAGEFTFWRDQTNGPLTVHFSLYGSAINGVDYTSLPASVTFNDGQRWAALAVEPIDDTLIEGEETVVLALAADGAYRTEYPSAALVTLQDNDQRVRVDASDFIAAEPGRDTGEFTFTRFGTTNTDLRVYFTLSGTASNGVDYVALTNGFVIPAGQLTATLPVVALDDALVEGAETLTLTLVADAAYGLETPTTATVTLLDDEPMITLTATVSNVVEGSQEPGVFKVSRTGDPKYEVTVHLAVGGSATYGLDYPPFLTNVFFGCGVMAIDLLVFPTNELAIEGIETVTADLLPDPTYTILSPSNAVLTIADGGTNLAPMVRITSPTVPTVFLLGTNVNLILESTISDDGDSNALTFAWSQVGGPAGATFGETNLNATVSFTNAGVYRLRLTANDGELESFAEVTAVVGPVELLAPDRLHWTLDEGGGTNAADHSGAGHVGGLTGNPVWTTNGVLGGALRLGGNGECVRTGPATNLLDGLPAFSISLWLRADATNWDHGILCGDDSGTNATLTLSTRTLASCGRATNVIEAVFPTTDGMGRRMSTGNAVTNAWQHLVLTWTNGSAPDLYLNGQIDQPLSQMVPLTGMLTNCPAFILGKGAVDVPSSWQGQVDDVRLFSRALSGSEVAALAALPPTNYAPVVDVGTNLTVLFNEPFELTGTVVDDGQPVPPGQVISYWNVVQSPIPFTLADTNSLTNTVDFPQSGEYVFRLIADDGQVKVYADLKVTTIEPTRIDLVATDPEAAELGPDLGQFTLTRTGDTNLDLPVYLAFSGTASNGADCVTLSNVVVFPAGIDTVQLEVFPYLDHRTEGDEPLTLTIISNRSYSLGSSEATVTIHDSPYGQWTIAHFTLEELTDPRLSGEEADFDRDRLLNLAEYAANRAPKTNETTAPLQTRLETDATNALTYVYLSYQRRLPPTDLGYEVAVSNDLLTWNTGTNYVEELQVTDDGNGLTETVQARLVTPFSQATNLFINVRVWLQTTGP